MLDIHVKYLYSIDCVNEIHIITERGGEHMTDFNMLEDIMKRSGATVEAVAKAANISRETYYNRKKGIGEFTASEIVAIVNVLRLTAEERDVIFLTEKVN